MNHWGWPQYVYLTMTLLTLGMAIAKHGEPKAPEKWSFWRSLLIAAIAISLLSAGGFFR